MSGTTSHDMVGTEEEGKSNHINVVLRTRPLNIIERHRQEATCLRYPGDGHVEVDWQGMTKYFRYNVVFEEKANQHDVFEHCGIKRLVELAVDGYACTCFAYGQTGSGKTHTITGPPSEFFIGKDPNPDVFGVMPRAFIYLYRLVRESRTIHYRIHASYFEIYNEQVIDLLNPDSNQTLGLRWHKTRGFYVENLFLIECETLDDMMTVLETGMKNRAFNSTSPNEYSSRSHSLFTIMVDGESRESANSGPSLLKHGKLTFVDLAGSEKVKDSGNLTTEQLQETQNINRSLLVLGNCISALVDPKKKNGHIPFRDSKLTKLLADSLGGTGITLMIACVSPSAANATETVNTLRYSSRARKIQNKPSMKMDPKEETIRQLKVEIRQLKQENQYLRENVRLSDPNSVGSSAKDRFSFPRFEPLPRPSDASVYHSIPDFPPPIQNGQDSQILPISNIPPPPAPLPINPHMPVVDNTLYTMLQEYMTENESLRSENSDLQKGRNRVKKEHESLKRENELLVEQLDKIKKRITTSPQKNVYSKKRYDYEPISNQRPSPLPQRGNLPSTSHFGQVPNPSEPSPMVHSTPTPLRGIPPPQPPIGQQYGGATHHGTPRMVRDRDIAPMIFSGDKTYSGLYDARRHSPVTSPRHHSPVNQVPRRLSPIQPNSPYKHDKEAIHPGLFNEYLDMNKNLKEELSKLDRTIKQHQRINALNQEIRHMSRK